MNNGQSHDDDAEMVVVEDDYAPAEAAPAKQSDVMDKPLLPEVDRKSKHMPVVIDDGKPPELDTLDPREIRRIGNQLAKGIEPHTVATDRGDLFALTRRNGFYFYLFLVQCVVILVLVVAIVNRVLNMPARGIPSTRQVENYRRAESEIHAVEHFAEMVASKMETWNHWSARDNPKRVIPYLDPAIRNVYEADFGLNIRDADRYLERQIFEPVDVKHNGIVRETIHKVLVFYQTYNGRGKDDKTFSLDRISRRLKILEIVEGAVTDENRYGLYVLKHNDLTERQFMDALEARGLWENPWNKALGIKQLKPTKQQQAAKDKK